MTPEQVLWLLFAALVFPGFVFTGALSLFTEWFLRKAGARMENRMGPSYVGPFGLLQPLADILKLLAVKEEVVQRHAMASVARVFLVLGIGAAVATLLMLPLSPVRLVADYDFLVFFYLYCLVVPLAFIFAGLSAPNPFMEVGVSRLLSLTLAVEPTFFTALLIPIALVSHLYAKEIPATYSIYSTSIESWKLWVNPVTLPAMILALVACIAAIQAKSLLPPFNIPEAEQEIIAGFETELSGPLLGLIRLLHDIDIALAVLFVTYVVLGGPYPFGHWSPAGIAVLVIKFVVLLWVVTVIRSSFGRFRIEQGIAAVLKYGFLPALLGLIYAAVVLALA